MIRKIKFVSEIRKKAAAIFIVLILVVGIIAIYNHPVSLAYNTSGISTGSSKLKTDMNEMVKAINSASPDAFDLFIKVTKECYPNAKINITKDEFYKFIALSHKKVLTSSDKQFMSYVTNNLKSSYYGNKSYALISLCRDELISVVKKDTLDIMKNQHCGYEEAKEKALNAVASSNPEITKELGLNSNVKILSTEQSREEAFLYAQPYDVASVLSNWGDLILYSIWTSHDGWVKEVVVGDDGTIGYLNIYEALPDGNWDSIHRYGPQSLSKGAYDSWIKNSLHVYIKRYPDYSLAQRAYNVSVNMYYGKPYNWNIANKYDPDRSYCSQNIWTGFWAYGVNLDSNLDIPMLYAVHPWAVSIEVTGVLPDSIYLSPHLELISSG